jgi:hypothetical protein
MLLLLPPLGAFRVGLDPTCLLGIRHADSRWVIHRNHQDAPPGGSLVVGRDADLSILELGDVRTRGGLCGARSVAFLVDLVP